MLSYFLISDLQEEGYGVVLKQVKIGIIKNRRMDNLWIKKRRYAHIGWVIYY